MAGKYSTDMLPDEVKRRLAQGEKINILDVREPQEWESGHIPDAKHIPLGFLNERLTELDIQKEMIVVCHSGNRSGLACEHLEELGYKVINMPGGMSKWTGDIE